ncbi:hypothetical protein Ciccas_012024 [Cichlidogyrus casuarinus]|uniref:Uncharacterized protein n=1 Tax=Cichlidogyrus casuarinus TaxID=1844966 RepID=A0ABD2PSL7_9PLAT
MNCKVTEQSPTDGNPIKIRRYFKLRRSTLFAKKLVKRWPARDSKIKWSTILEKIKHAFRIKKKSACKLTRIDEEVPSGDDVGTKRNLDKDGKLQDCLDTEYQKMERKLNQSELDEDTKKYIREVISDSNDESKGARKLLYQPRTWEPVGRLKKANEMHDELLNKIECVRMMFYGDIFLIMEIVCIGCIIETLLIIGKIGLFATKQFCEDVRSVKNYYSHFEREKTWKCLELLVNFRVNFTDPDDEFLVIQEVLQKIEHIYIKQMEITEETARDRMKYEDDTLVRSENFFKGLFKKAFKKKNDIQLYDDEARRQLMKHSRGGFRSMCYSKNKSKDSEVTLWQVTR